MALHDGRTLMSIPREMILAPSHHKRRSCPPILEESFDLPDLVAEGIRQGYEIKISLAGLQRAKDVSDTGRNATGQHARGRNFSFDASLATESLETPIGSNHQTLNRLRQHSTQTQTILPQPTALTPQIPEHAVFQSLRQFRFPTKDVLANSNHDSAPLETVFEMDPLEVHSHIQIPPHSTNIQRPRNSVLSLLRRVSVFSHISTLHRPRHPTLDKLFDDAKKLEATIYRSVLYQKVFQYVTYALLLAALYFILVGLPLWKGLVWWIYNFLATKFVLTGGCAVFSGIAFLYAFAPLLIVFEKDPMKQELRDAEAVKSESNSVESCALLIPCYKSESLIGSTLEAALKVFPAKNIFVIANGNSPEPLDNTADVCHKYHVNHIWCPIGSKIIAQFLGCYAAEDFLFTLLIDDDCILPPEFPIVTDRMKGNIKCLGYTIKSVGPGGQPGTLCQQAQDIEYKLSGLQRAFAGKVGSATFPHGAIALWDRELLMKTFHCHPGFSISEDWFFGHVARELGSRILMCTQVFVETETPPAIFWVDNHESRGGFGEMTIYKQRFYRWNFFFVNDCYWNIKYILLSWKLGWWEIGAKVFVWQEVYETIIFLLTPFVLPISLIIRPEFCAILLATTFGMYFINVIIFNEVHLRKKNQRVSWVAMLYYMPYKMTLFLVNVASCYYSIYKYAKYFAKRHPKVVHDAKVIQVILDFVELPENEASSVLTHGRDNGAKEQHT